MQVRMFDLAAPLPFAQGCAINAIVQQVGGKVQAAGEVESEARGVLAPECDSGVGLYYLKLGYRDRVVESVWLDNGCEVECVAINDSGAWRKRSNQGAWEVAALGAVAAP